MNPIRLCNIEGCSTKHFCKGFCKAHFNRYLKGQDLTPPINSRKPAILHKTHPVYVAWTNMKTRCDNPKSTQYKWYGGRSITYCERWKSFENFYVDMIDTWYPGLTLDRKENDEDYSPDNCRWANKQAQAENRNPRGYLDGRK